MSSVPPLPDIASPEQVAKDHCAIMVRANQYLQYPNISDIFDMVIPPKPPVGAPWAADNPYPCIVMQSFGETGTTVYALDQPLTDVYKEYRILLKCFSITSPREADVIKELTRLSLHDTSGIYSLGTVDWCYEKGEWAGKTREKNSRRIFASGYYFNVLVKQ